MKLNRREFLRATGLAGVLTALGIDLPEATKKLPAVIPSTGQVEIQYNAAEQGRRWAFKVVSDKPACEDGFLVPSGFQDWLMEVYVSANDAEMLEAT